MNNLQQLKRLLSPFLNGLPIIIGCILCMVFIASKIVYYATPMYESTGRMKLEEVIKAIETDGKDGSNALMALEENARAPAVEATHTDDEEVVDSSQIAQLRKQIRDLEEISASREQQIEEVRKLAPLVELSSKSCS